MNQTNPTQKLQHQIFFLLFYTPMEFAWQINLNLDSMWGILPRRRPGLQAQAGQVRHPEGPNKKRLLLFKLPMGGDSVDSVEEESGGEGDAMLAGMRGARAGLVERCWLVRESTRHERVCVVKTNILVILVVQFRQ